MALMNWSSSSSSSSWMVAQAKEELEVLEAMHPNRFGYLKLELKSFIAEESDQYKLFSSSSSLSPVSTQVSVCEASSSRKRKSQEVHKMSDKCRRLNGSKGRFDAAIKRAQACLGFGNDMSHEGSGCIAQTVLLNEIDWAKIKLHSSEIQP